MKLFAHAFIVASSVITLGCTKGTAGFDTLDAGSLPQPIFLGATDETLSVSAANETLNITGDCDPRITNLLGAAVGTATTFSTLALMATSPITIDCANTGHFSFTLKSLSDLGFTPQNNQTYNVTLRGVTSGGISNPSTIHITYSTGSGPDPKHILLTGGSTTTNGLERYSSDAHYKATIQVTARGLASIDSTVQDAMTTKKGSHYMMKSGPAAQ